MFRIKEESRAPRVEEEASGDAEPDDLWPTIFWFLQFLSTLGFFFGFWWITGAFLSQHQGNNADHVSVVGGSAWDIGVVPVIIAASCMTLVQMLTGLRTYGWPGLLGAFCLQSAMAAVLYLALQYTHGIGWL